MCHRERDVGVVIAVFFFFSSSSIFFFRDQKSMHKTGKMFDGASWPAFGVVWVSNEEVGAFESIPTASVLSTVVYATRRSFVAGHVRTHVYIYIYINVCICTRTYTREYVRRFARIPATNSRRT